MKLSTGSIHTRDNQNQKYVPITAEEFNSFVVPIRHFPRPDQSAQGVLLELASHEPVAGRIFALSLATSDRVVAIGYVSRIIDNGKKRE